MQINFRFRFWSCGYFCVIVMLLCTKLYTNIFKYGVISILRNAMATFRHVWFVEESRGRHMKAHSKNFVMKVLFTGPEFQLFGDWLPKFTGLAKLNGASLHFCLWQYHLLIIIRMICAVTGVTRLLYHCAYATSCRCVSQRRTSHG